MTFGKLGARGGVGSLGVLGGVTFLAPVQLSAVSPAADAQCWFHEPRAFASAGKLWFGTNGSNDNTTATGRATIYEINEASGAVSRRDLITGTDWGDDHAYPVVLPRSDGRLVVFYCSHNVTQPIRYRVSVSVGTMLGGWSQEYTIGVDTLNPTYPSPVRLTTESNKVYIFFRDGVAGSLSYVTSTDLDSVSAPASDGAALGATPTWSSETQLTVSTGAKKGIYTKVHSNNADRIDLLMTDAEADAAGVKKDIRHTYYSGGNWFTSDGTSLGNASTPIVFTSFTAVATSGAPDNFGDVWVWHIQRRSSGTIEAVFARFISTSEHHYYYARWNGSAWSKIEIDAGFGSGTPDTRSAQITDGAGSTEGYYSPGLYLDTKDEGVVYCSIGYSSYSVLYRYITANQGSTWTRQRVSGMIKENIRPFVPLNRSPKYAVFWASGDYHFWNFNSTNDTSYGYTTHITAASRGYAFGNAAPINTAVPTISGTASTGNVLTAAVGTWTGDLPMPFTYQWNRDGVAIGGQTSSTYTVISGDVGHNLSVTVAASNAFGSANATSANAPGLPVNLLAHSEAIDLWTNGNGTITTNVANEPVNGQTTADRFTESALASSFQHNSNAANISFTASTAYTFSAYVKYENRQFLQLLFGSAAFGLNAYANFDIQNGTVQTVGSAATASIVNAGNGWFRIVATATATGTSSTTVGVFGIDAGNAARGEAYVAGTAHTWLLTDVQVETGSAANTYVPTA